MRSTLNTLLLFLLCTASLSAQIDLSPDQWREDLRFLQKTVHEDYDFLFKKVTPEVFDAEVEKLYQDIPNLAGHEVIVGLARITALFGYGHTGLSLSAWDLDNRRSFRQMPYNLYHFSDGVYVQGVHQKYERALGAKVLAVEGTPAEDALAAVRPAFPAENDMFFKAHGLHYLGVPEILHAQGVTETLQSTVTLTLQKGEETFKVTFEPADTEGFPGAYGLILNTEHWRDARDPSDTPLWLKNLDRISYFEYLPAEKTLYVRQSQIQDDPEEPIPAFYERVFDFVKNNDVERLVLDVRLNGGGNNYKNKPIVTGLIKSEKINRPGHFFVIIGRRTFSACQNLVNELDNYTNAIFVGEPTGENINFYGDVNRVQLPHSELTVRLSFAWWQDKPQWENDDWLPPHLATEMSFEDYRTNRDPALAAVLAHEDEDFVLDPMQYLTDLFMAGKLEEVRSEAHRLTKDPRYQFFRFQQQFNRAGYNLLGDGQVEPALFVFGLNAELFPESPNVWDSLAEAHWKAGKTEKAVELYQKTIEMDPEGQTGANARDMLDRIRTGGK